MHFVFFHDLIKQACTDCIYATENKNNFANN